MRYGIAKAQYVVLALLMLVLSACGTAGTQTVGSGIQASGKLTANVVMPKNAGKTVALAGGSVTTTRLMVTGPTTPTARKDFAGNTGGTLEVYPGTGLIVSAQALDKDGVVLYEGLAADVAVGTSSTTTVTIDLNAPVVKAADANCLACHESSRDITGQNLIADFKQSGHYTNVRWTSNAKLGVTGTGCAGCHGTQHNDVQPAANGRCFECHGANLSLKHTSASALIEGEANPARYLNLNGTNCSACHEPHNPIDGAGKLQREQWSESGHGDINAWPWAHYDFTKRDICNSCHTSAGFAKAINNNFTNKSAFSTTSTLGKQPLTCDGCHSSNDFKNSVRTLQSAYVVPYTPSLGASATLPGKEVVGNSELCFPCHSGLVSGQTINALPEAGMNNIGFQNSHYMAAAGLMYVKIGYSNFIDPATAIGTSTYGKSLTSDADGGALTSTHRKLGTTAINGDSHNIAYFTPGNMDSNGPCVTCHMPKAGHTWEINADSFNEVCVKCHSAEGTTTLTAGNFKTVFIEEQGAVYEDALALALSVLKSKYNISFNQAVYPYFYDNNLTPAGAVKDWTRGGTLTNAQAKNLMGACFNINVLKRDPAAFAHARTYARRLLYDTIDFLDDNAINMSTGATAIAKNPTLYVKGTTAIDASTTEAYKYLAGYNRTTGAWNALERP